MGENILKTGDFRKRWSCEFSQTRIQIDCWLLRFHIPRVVLMKNIWYLIFREKPSFSNSSGVVRTKTSDAFSEKPSFVFFFFLTTTTASSSGEVWTVGLTVEIKAVFSNFFRPWCGRSLGSGCTPDRWTPDRDRFEAWDRKASVFCGLESFLLHAYVLRWKNT